MTLPNLISLAVAPLGDTSGYAGMPVVEETVYRTPDGKTIIYRRVVVGQVPAGHNMFWFTDQVGLKTPQGTMPINVAGPLPGETLMEALAGYDDAVQAEGQRRVSEMEGNARRNMLANGIPGGLPPIKN